MVLSVFELPLSLPLARSGVDGADGSVESSVYVSADEAAEVPIEFVDFAVMEIEPAESAVVVATQTPALFAVVFGTDDPPETVSY